MALEIVNWNVAQNIEWFVRLADAGAAVSVEMYLTQAAAEARTGLQASGLSSGYGSALEVVLENDPAAVTPVSLFQAGYAWHLVVAGQSGDSPRIMRIRQFVDLDEVIHPIYRAQAAVAARATAEINAHTHARYTRSIILGLHLPAVEAGDIVRINSVLRGLDTLGQVFEHRISGAPDNLTSDVEVVSFASLRR